MQSAIKLSMLSQLRFLDLIMHAKNHIKTTEVFSCCFKNQNKMFSFLLLKQWWKKGEQGVNKSSDCIYS